MDNEEDQRKEARIKRSYYIKYRQAEPAPASEDWDANTPIDISKSGISFYSAKRFTVGAKIHLKMSNPLLYQECLYIGTVVRCRSSKKMPKFYEVAATIEANDPEAKEAFEKAIEMFVAQKKDVR